jgi:single-stranded DNA-binding protein
MSAEAIKTEIRTQAIGRISRKPELSRTTAGVPVCRFAVATDAGPASNPVVRTVYVVGGPERRYGEKLAVRVSHLGIGDLVVVPGVERQRRRKVRGVEFTESAIEATAVRLRERRSGARA